MTDGSGEIPLDLVIQRLDTLDEIYRRSLSFRFTNPLQEVRCVLRIRDRTFPAAGYYQVILLTDNEPVAQRRVRLVAKEAFP